MRAIALTSSALLVAIIVGQAAAQAPPYREEEVTVSSGGVTLAGTLTIPAGTGPFPAVVLLSGSGAQDRDSTLLGFRPFKTIADHLARAGFAVLRCDDRGVGGSTGTTAESTTEDLADDALAAIRVLANRPEVQRTRIGLLGHSEGALVGAIAAAKHPEVAFLIWMAGSARRGDDILRSQAVDLARAGGADEALVARIAEEHRRLTSAVAAGAPQDQLAAQMRVLARAQLAAAPEAQRRAVTDVDAWLDSIVPAQVAAMRSRWLQFFIGFDPATALAKVTCPVLALFGGRDLQVRLEDNRRILETALASAGNSKVKVQVYTEANHLFIPAVTGHPNEYATLPKEFVAPLLGDLTDWLAGTLR